MNLHFIRVALHAALAASVVSGCAGGISGSSLPAASPEREHSPVNSAPASNPGPASQPAAGVTPSITEIPVNANGVTGGIALGYDGAVWFTQNNSNVGRYLNGAFSSAGIVINEFNYQQIPAFPILTADPQGVYTGVELDEEQGFAVLENIVQVTYSRNVRVTGGVQYSFVNASMNAVSAGDSTVFATGSYNSTGTPACTSCLYLLEESGKSAALNNSYEVGQALAYAGGAVYVAAAESTPNGNQTGVSIYKFNPVTLAGHKVATLAAPSNILGMTAGPDNLPWFTDAGRNAIGHLDAAGHVTEFALPTAHASPNGITAAADGALWFTETNADKIGRITTGGAITELHVPTANALPAGITGLPVSPCSVRAIWFAETHSGKLGRITY